MGSVTHLVDYRAERGLPPFKAKPPALPPSKQEIRDAVIRQYGAGLQYPNLSPEAHLRLLATAAAKRVTQAMFIEGTVPHHAARLQFFGVRETGGEQYLLLLRVPHVVNFDNLRTESAMFVLEPGSLLPTRISSDSDITKNSSYTALTTLPMTEFYKV